MLGITITTKKKIQELENCLEERSSKMSMLERHNLKLRLSNAALNEEKIKLQDHYDKIKSELRTVKLQLETISAKYIRPRDKNGKFLKPAN